MQTVAHDQQLFTDGMVPIAVHACIITITEEAA
jgi:hypothetical protein